VEKLAATISDGLDHLRAVPNWNSPKINDRA
jgi:hypothetical protein